MNSNKQQKN